MSPQALVAAPASRSCTILAYQVNMTTSTATDWRSRLVEDDAGIRRILEQTRRVAVLGIKTADSGQPAYYVPEYAQAAGYEIVPVPVYYPDVTEILGERVYRRLVDIPGEIDLVDVFRRPKDIPPHVDDMVAKRPKAVWFQSGIRNEEAAERLAKAGIDVVQDRCLLVELKRMGK
jgi:uncharacterized protein